MRRLIVKLVSTSAFSLAIILSINTYSVSTYAAHINYLDVQIENNSTYQVNDIRLANDRKGSLQALRTTIINTGELVDTASFSTNYLGQLSQDLVFNLSDTSSNQVIGSCSMHFGIGSYLTRPDFSGSICVLTNGDYIQLNPRYEIAYGAYHVYFKVSKTKNFSRIFVFGDSMSDNGNLYKRSVEISLIFPISPIVPISPPYFNGRFTNGKVWVERLSDKLNISEKSFIDYAYAGATVGKNKYPIPSLDKQVSSYLYWNPSGDPYALYTVWIGSNDLLNYNNDIDEVLLDDIRKGMEYNLKRLINHGAKHILSPQLPDLSVTPHAMNRDKKNGNTDFSEKLATLVVRYNTIHRQLITKLRKEFPDVQILTFDTYNFIQKARDHAADYGFTNIKERCNPNYYWNDNLDICQKPTEYVYWDGVHPSERSHAIIADLMFSVLSRSGYEPNVKLLANQNLPDDVDIRNKKAVEELIKSDIPVKSNNANINLNSELNSGKNKRLFNLDFTGIVEDNAPLY
jgi:phospholipase/lecithinase/hemolysin